jgi:hypothetical protein
MRQVIPQFECFEERQFAEACSELYFANFTVVSPDAMNWETLNLDSPPGATSIDFRSDEGEIEHRTAINGINDIPICNIIEKYLNDYDSIFGQYNALTETILDEPNGREYINGLKETIKDVSIRGNLRTIASFVLLTTIEGDMHSGVFIPSMAIEEMTLLNRERSWHLRREAQANDISLEDIFDHSLIDGVNTALLLENDQGGRITAMLAASLILPTVEEQMVWLDQAISSLSTG